MTADTASVLRRLRTEEDGFGLLELIISMLVLNIGLLALVAAFNSGSIALKRASQVSTATALGERQMELYRGVKYDAIGLHASSYTSANSGGSLYNQSHPATGTAYTASTACPDATTSQCMPTQTVTGPDGRSYRIDSYVTTVAASGTHDIKVVRVIVRDGAALTSVLVRAESTFDASTGS